MKKVLSMKYKVLGFKRSKILFLLTFILLGFIALRIPFTQLVGSNVKFTLFDFFAPTAGAFLGTGLGVIAVFTMQAVNLLVNGVDKGAVIRLFPILFAVVFFSLSAKKKTNRLILAVPLASMIIFNLHPIGRSVWFYSLYWLIPILMWPLSAKSLAARALGSTFTAHAVGGAAWIWAFNLPAPIWISLIPVVALERGIFALGICASYLVFNNLLALLSTKSLLTRVFSFDKRYVLKYLK